MTQDDRTNFEAALDLLATIIGTRSRTPQEKTGFFMALRGHQLDTLVDAMNHLAAHWAPRWRDDFPPPAVVKETINSLARQESATLQDLEESFKRRGIRIVRQGEESTEGAPCQTESNPKTP